MQASYDGLKTRKTIERAADLSTARHLFKDIVPNPDKKYVDSVGIIQRRKGFDLDLELQFLTERVYCWQGI